MNKMIGRTKIELFDYLTGKLKERVEEKNMVTNAVPKIFNAALSSGYAIGACGVNDVYVNSLVNTLFGGLLLFDNTITENANNFYAPSGVHLTACGVKDNTTSYESLPQLGVYVPAESTSSAHARSWVYEFGTTQGNGTHACVCLTHQNAGWAGYGVNTDAGNIEQKNKTLLLSNIIANSTLGMKDRSNRQPNYGTVGSEYADICIDFDNKEKYMMCVYANRVHIIKHKIYPVNISVFRAMNEYQPYTEVADISGTFSGSYFWNCYNTDEKKVYFFTSNIANLYAQNSISVTVYSIDLTTGTLATVGTWSTNLGGNKYIYVQDFMVNNGKLYFTSNDGIAYVYNFSTGTTTALTMPTGIQSSVPIDAYVINGLIFMPKALASTSSTSRYRDLIIDTSDDSTRASINAILEQPYNGNGRFYGRIIPPYDVSEIVFGSEMRNNLYIGGINVSGDTTALVNTFAPTNYLATINNLSSPVTKTASQSMKVTYSLEEVEE